MQFINVYYFSQFIMKNIFEDAIFGSIYTLKIDIWISFWLLIFKSHEPPLIHNKFIFFLLQKKRSILYEGCWRIYESSEKSGENPQQFHCPGRRLHSLKGGRPIGGIVALPLPPSPSAISHEDTSLEEP